MSRSSSKFVADADDQVHLEKSVDRSGHTLPSIVYEFTNARDQAVAVRLFEAIPEDVDPPNLGFHREHGSQHWSIEEDQLIYESVLEPDTSVETLVGLREVGDARVEQLLTAPETFETETRPDATTGQESTTRAWRSGTADIAESNPDSTAPTGPGEGSEMAADNPAEASDSGTDATRSWGGTQGSLVAALARELEERSVSEEHLETLRDAIPAAGAQPEATRKPSVEARIEQVQTELADLRAYRAALESFLDEEGGAEAVMEGFEHRVDRVENRLAEIDDTVEDTREELQSQEEVFEEVLGNFEDISAEVTSIAAAVDDLSDRIERLETEMPPSELESQVATLETELESVEARVEQHDERLGEMKTLQENLRRVFASDPSDDH